MVTPDLIPNSAVKHSSGDDTRKGKVACRQIKGFNCAKEKGATERSRLFLCPKLCYDMLMEFQKTMDWAQKRKILYAGVAVLVLVLLAAYPIYRVVYSPPTCADQKQNGYELGVDCGGECALYCPMQVKEPRVVWVKAFSLSPGLYNVGAYVENSNKNAGIKNARYTIRVFDATGQVLADRMGAIEIAPVSTALIFEGNFALDTPPSKVEIEFNKDDLNHFVKASATPSVLFAKNKSLKNTDSKPRFDAILLNTDLVNDVGRIELGAVIYDAARRPIAISRTYVEDMSKGSEQPIFFTWPNRFTKNNRGGICATPVDTILVFDRSGSMDVGKKSPPEPLTSAKNAAISYVDAAELSDKVGLVSFATAASNPIDHELSIDHERVKGAIAIISIEKGSVQYTNLGDALRAARVEFQSARHTKDGKQVIVALTDGVADNPLDNRIANRPLDPVNPKNTKYAEEYAATEADSARAIGIEIYIVELGNKINEVFLRNRITANPSRYFNAPTVSDLQAVYKKIAEGVCEEENFITEIVITPRAVFVE